MSGYKVEEEDETYYTGNLSYLNDEYWFLYSNKQKKRNNNVLKQLTNIWLEVYNCLMVLRHYDVDTNPIMERISKYFLLTLKSSKTQINDINQRISSNKKRLQRLNKLSKQSLPL